MLVVCNSLAGVYDFGMTEMIRDLHALKVDTVFISMPKDFDPIDATIEELVDELDKKLQFALTEAEEVMVATRALAGRLRNNL